jgi:hypothetical protein
VFELVVFLDLYWKKYTHTFSLFIIDYAFCCICVVNHPSYSSKKDPEETKDNSEFAEATQEAQNGLSRQRKGKYSNSSKLSQIGIITKSTSQDFQWSKRLIKLSYGSKDIHGQHFGQPNPISRDELASVLMMSASVQMISSSVQSMWYMYRETCVMLTSA